MSRPHAVVDQRLLERRGVTAARHHRSDRAADTLLEPPAHLGRLAGVAARALLDHAFDRRDREGDARCLDALEVDRRSEEHTSELQSLMRISYAVFCLKKKTSH